VLAQRFDGSDALLDAPRRGYEDERFILGASLEKFVDKSTPDSETEAAAKMSMARWGNNTNASTYSRL
jgi:hypothetical protein